MSQLLCSKLSTKPSLVSPLLQQGPWTPVQREGVSFLTGWALEFARNTVSQLSPVGVCVIARIDRPKISFGRPI
jgi:hypothetical protein